jgi:hypothetical protein
MSKSKARVFVPLMTVDEEQRLVYGRITQEVLDKSGEVMDYETSKPNFEKWSNEIHEASGGLSKGNVRVMHGLSVAGKLTDLSFDDDEKAIDVCAKVVDDAEWNKVLEGCYTGFSVGGSYGKKWTETANDNKKIKKFTAVPNEVSLVDNPCVPSATFQLVKADGAEELIEFKVEHDADQWPELAKAEDGMKEGEPEAGVTDDDEETAKKKKAKAEKAAPSPTVEPTAAQVAEKAGELAKAADDGTTWADHIEAAREELAKVGATQAALEQQRQEGKAGEGAAEEETEEGKADEGAEDSASGDEASGAVEKTTPPGVKQMWTASDGKTFEKKADAMAHEEAFQKAPEPKTDADKLRERLSKALQPEDEAEVVSILSLDRVDDLHKAVLELELPRGEDGAPLLEKGMYTVSRFANMLGDVAGLARTIKAEGKLEGNDKVDSEVAAELTKHLGAFGDSFMDYSKQQIAELVAGLDADLSPRYAYDYYYRAAGEGNDLAKNVVELIEAVEDELEQAVEQLEKLAKTFGYVEATPGSTDDDVLSPPMQKRFDALGAENAELKKVAGEAVEKVEELAKRMQAIEDTPLPRAPRNFMEKGGDGMFFGKQASTEAEKIAVVQEMLATHGPDAMATMMIKASHAQGGQQLRLKQQ